VLYEQLRDEWHARKRAVAVSSVLTFTPEGLVLGVGTVIVPVDRPRRLQSLRSREPRVLALLSAACGKAVAPSVLGNIERAMKAWNQGDDCLAYIHLAHAGLRPLYDLQRAAYRLFMARCALSHGASPRDVFKALHLDPHYIDAVEKFYNPAQPRVPAGSGRTSGEWTDGEGEAGDGTEAPAASTAKEDVDGAGTGGASQLSRMPSPPARSFLGELSAAQVAELGAYAFRALRVATPAGGAAAVFGLLFIPSPNEIHVEGDVPDIPGLRYSWNRDETQLLLKYDGPDGAHHAWTATLEDDLFRDKDGNIVGRVLPQGTIVVDTAAASRSLVQDDEPKLCPKPVKDRRTNEKGKAFEIYVKSIINPGNPTPPDMAYDLPNPNGGKPVSFDDCERTSGMLVEIKDHYEWALEKAEKYPQLLKLIKEYFLKQSSRDIDASGGRPVAWFFSEHEVAVLARQLFDEDQTGKRQRIVVVDMFWWRENRQ
jgi:hypothetical protein